MNRFLVFASVLCLSFAATATAAAKDLERQLQSHYRNKVLPLRYFFTAASQEFDQSGAPINPGEQGPWTVYGQLIINNITLRPDKLEVEGEREGYRYDGKKLMAVDLGQKATLLVHLATPISNWKAADHLMKSLFVTSRKRSSDDFPDFWRDYLARPGKSHGVLPPPGADVLSPQDGVEPPKPIYTPDPEFTDAARKNGVQGSAVFSIIVDKAGRVVAVKVLRPLGLGLDENAADRLKTWKFQPAKKSGQPVAVVMGIEISFELKR